MLRTGLLACRLPHLGAYTNLVSSVPKHNLSQLRAFRQRVQARVYNERSGVYEGIRGVGALQAGQLAVGGASVAGLGALCYYGLGLASEAGAIDRAHVWPEYVRTRIRDTYGYLGASLAVVAGSAATIFNSAQGQRFMRLCERHPIASTVGIIAAMIGSGTAVRAVPYEPGLGVKQGLWLLNAAVLGLAIAPIGVLGGALAVRAAWYTAGVVGGLSTVAVCAPSDRFLNWGGALGIGLGAVFCASIGSAFLPPTTALGMGIHSLALYGGLILFAAFLLYDTQKVIQKAERAPKDGGSVWNGYGWVAAPRFDPINNSHHILLDVINIFVRIAQMLAMGGGRRK